jgi:hypothetical protein
MQSLQLHLTGAARSWLSKLEKETIGSWEELTKQFTSNFKSTYKRPASIEEVKACVQQRGETLRAYIQRWSIIKNLAVEVSDERAIDAFIIGLQQGDLVEEMDKIKPKTVSDLMDVANRFADREDACNNKRTRSPEYDSRNRYGGQRRRSRNYDNYGSHSQVAIGYKDNSYQGNDCKSLGYRNYGREDYKKFLPRESREYNPSPEDMLNGPCHIHSVFVDGKRVSRHAIKDCTTFLKLQEAALNKQAEAKRQGYERNTSNAPTTQQGNSGAPKGQDKSNQGRDDDEGYVLSKGHITAMIKPVPKSNKEEKSITRQVNLAITSPPATTEYLHWSEQPIEFSREDHPIIVPRPGNAPLVLKAQIGTYDVDIIFMDAGSRINLIYAKTLRAMHISLEFLKPTDCSFHRIVPGSANYPLGRIALNVCFGNWQNYRREKLDFKVMDWPSQYHAILGRPAFSRFMAVPHYTYLVLKMPGPKGIIMVKGSFELSDICDKEFHNMAQNFGMMASYGEPNGKTKSTTTGVAQQLEGNPKELEVKKPRVQPPEQEKSTGEEEKTQAT